MREAIAAYLSAFVLNPGEDILFMCERLLSPF